MQKPPIDDLRQVVALRDIPEEHIQWIYDRCDYMEFNDGDCIFKIGNIVDVMWLLVEGKVDFYMGVNGKLVYYFTFINDENIGGVGGLLPYSRMKTVPGNSYAVGKVRVFELHKKYFQELEVLNPELIQRLIGYMTERARAFATHKLQTEKVNALGQLAAGIAHELNNPAAAINRISGEMIKRLMQNYDLTEKILNSKINSEQIKFIHQLVDEKKEKIKSNKLTAMQRIEREDEINDWLTNLNISTANFDVAVFISSGFLIEDFENIRNQIGETALTNVLTWLENLLSSQSLIKDLNDASCRISTLVGAIKSHVHMDRTNEMQPTNVHTDLENTLTLLGYKLRDKNITVRKEFCNNLREVPAYIGELNQVWTNIIDNSIFAMEKDGVLIIQTHCTEKEVIVSLIDNGKGIPPEIVSRIFDPFFTTKKVGEGTGIGLDIVMRIVKRHDGDVRVNSVPGRTEFSVSIPFEHEHKTIE